MAAATGLLVAEQVRNTASVHAEHGDFVWKTLQRFNVPSSDLEDVFQEVFVVVHRRLDSYDESARLTTWLFGICRRVTADYRRRVYRWREQPSAQVSRGDPKSPCPEDTAARAEARRRLACVLDELDLDQRAAFVMFEVEGMECSEIAELLDIPVGTVHSRLHNARKAFQKALGRLQAREAHRR